MNVNDLSTPLFDALVEHHQIQPLSFHVPGHKYGTFFYEKGFSFFQEVLKLDVTELTNLDDLHAPEGVIMEAQQLAATLYGAKSTYFLVNGSSVGNLAMILSCCQEADYVLVQRNCHKSIIHGIQLAGAIPVFLAPQFDDELHVPSYVSINTIQEAIEQYPNAKALILTNPNYYGLSYTKLKDVIALAHIYNIPVLVDEAHGAHFIASSFFPTSAVELGADIVIHSAHKTLPALTMGSYLHFNSSLIHEEKVKQYLRMLQTSSPSYLIMASLDLARAYVQKLQGKEKEIQKGITFIVEMFEQLHGIRLVKTKNGDALQDPLKLTIQSTNGLTGYELQQVFETSAIFPELADPFNVLLILPLTTEWKIPEHLTKLQEILKMMNKQSKKGKNQIPPIFYETRPVSRLPVSYKELNKYSKTYVPFEQAIGKLSAEMIIPYPPGIPLLMNGERIEKEHIEQIQVLVGMKAKIQGGDRLKDKYIKIYG